MSGVFGLEMENYQGDLNDIVRASAAQQSDMVPWHQQFISDPLSFSSSAASMEDHRVNAFGDPFSTMRDSLLLNEFNGSSPPYFSSPISSNDHCMINIEDSSSFSAGGLDDMTSPCNIFSRIQISHGHSSSRGLVPPPPPCDPPVMAASSVTLRGHKAPVMLPSDMLSVNTSRNCLIDNTTASVPVQISSPGNLGIKRRKSQAKKVVCIPAPAAANSRSCGEVVPSDLWAWRKYGQKPIKGSPYPRGYYRCSSSKGCSARKQVERSRTDPNMLVITYTSEHNHPWPIQKNVLAGSTRSQPSKANASSSTGSKIGSPSNSQPQNTIKETNNNNSTSTSVKEEQEIEDIEKHIDDNQTYIPALPESQQQTDQDFFADLDELELETAPSNLLFKDDQRHNENKPIDPFALFDYNNNSLF
ncbi:putative WRKY transcription factor 14 [Hibiscus syriacus]|uniref:WRKY transcription factor 14 n=1 Tax=Hibiscus syriacus TaxID=106335 RepID=A0A6A2Y418_HIBSY|nr:probable WRKY transcription factor 14 isoform X2 [Hibiscus syriacus]KAE8670516.1 putative WRKY transcription factor 14 [Hibiscus syriacus]